MRFSILASLLLVTACGDGDRAAAPTAGQSEQLDDAEAMLNAEADKEKGPER